MTKPPSWFDDEDSTSDGDPTNTVSNSWFDDVTSIDEPQETPIGDRAEPFPSATPADEPEPRGHRRAIVNVVCLLAAVTGLVGTAFWLLRPSNTASSSVQHNPTFIATDDPVTSSTSPTDTPVDKCPNQPAPTSATLEGTFVLFQQAYFAGDIPALTALIDSSSYLSAVDWGTVAVQTQGAEFCVNVIDKRGTRLDAATTVVTPKGEELLWLQTITLSKKQSRWLVVSIDDRQPAQA